MVISREGVELGIEQMKMNSMKAVEKETSIQREREREVRLALVVVSPTPCPQGEKYRPDGVCEERNDGINLFSQEHVGEKYLAGSQSSPPAFLIKEVGVADGVGSTNKTKKKV